MMLCRTRKRLSITKMRSRSNVTLIVPTMIETPDVIPRIETEDADGLGQEIAEDPEITIVGQVVIEGIGEIILLVGEILTEPTDLEEIITGTTISATIDVGIILIPIRTTISIPAMTRTSIKGTIMYQIVRQSLNVVRGQAAPIATAPKINLHHFTFFFLLIDTNEILLK